MFSGGSRASIVCLLASVVINYVFTEESATNKHKCDESEQGRNVRRKSSKNKEKAQDRQTDWQWNTNLGDDSVTVSSQSVFNLEEFQPHIFESSFLTPDNYYNPLNIDSSQQNGITFLPSAHDQYFQPQDEQNIQLETGFSNIENLYCTTNNVGESSNQNSNFEAEIAQRLKAHKFIEKDIGYCFGNECTGKRKEVKTKCSVCKRSYCATCFMKLHGLDDLPQIEVLVPQVQKFPEFVNCFHCGKALANKQKSLSNHLYRCSGRTKDFHLYTCSVCNKKFPRKYNLEKHLRIHTGEKPYICDYCKASFSDDSNFRKHIDRHNRGLL